MQRQPSVRARPGGAKRFRVRSRGPRIWILRWIGVLVGLYGLVSWLAGGGGPAAAVIVAALAWELWLVRPCLILNGDGVTVRDLVGSTSYGLDVVRGFAVRLDRQPLDLLARTAYLFVVLEGGHEVRVEWISWQDLVTPLLSDGERPPRPSQQRLLELLHADLAGWQARTSPTEGSRGS